MVQDIDYRNYRLLPLTARSRLDPRDYLYRSTPPPDIEAAMRAGELPSEMDLHAEGLMPDPWDQGQEGSCTGHGEAGAMMNSYIMAGQPPPERFSPRYIYWRERVVEGTTDQDAGAEPRDGCDQLVKVGACLESKCPYAPGDFATAPPTGADEDAGLHKASRYESLVGWQWITQALGADKRFIPVATPWFNEWFNPPNGVLPLVNPKAPPAGGHMPGFCGYAYRDGVLYLRLHNSWGSQWGDGTGHAWLQADRSDDYLWERWAIIAAVEQPQPKPQGCQVAATALADEVIAGYDAALATHPRSTSARYGKQGARAVRQSLTSLPQ